jgi:hypothetical protein
MFFDFSMMLFILIFCTSSMVESGATRRLEPSESSPQARANLADFRLLLNNEKESARYETIDVAHCDKQLFGEEPTFDPNNDCHACLEELGDDRDKLDYCRLGTCKIWIHSRLETFLTPQMSDFMDGKLFASSLHDLQSGLVGCQICSTRTARF